MQISIQNLTKKYHGAVALREVSLEIDPGQVVCVVGANGAGKTTLMRALATLAAPTSGQICFDGEPLRRDRLDQRRRLFFLADTPIISNMRTVAGHIASVLKIYERNSPQLPSRVAELLEEVDLLPYVLANSPSLSRGQRYKAAFATMVACDCDLWLVDEPFASGIDPQGLSAVRRHFRAAADRGRTVVFTTQILDLAQRVADRLCILHQGQVHAFGTIDEIRAQRADADLEAILAALRDEEHSDEQG